MPLYEVRLKATVEYTSNISADTEDEAIDKAFDEAAIPHIGDEYDSGDFDFESARKLAEDGEYDSE